MKILVTGSAGFIGFHVAAKLSHEGHDVVGMDNINDYYSTQLKFDRLKESGFPGSDIETGKLLTSGMYANYQFIRLDLCNAVEVAALFEEMKFECVIHLAAQAGVRYSLENPRAYVDSNVTGFLNILEGCRQIEVNHLIFASSSSVYGLNTRMPYSETDNVDHPASLYAATKKSDELMAHVYSHLYGIPASGLRFFTAYGPWGRPDMAYYLFTNAIDKGEEINVFNQGDMSRDFTYISDVVDGVVALVDMPPQARQHIENLERSPHSSTAPYRILNIGNNKPENLETLIELIEKHLGKKARRTYWDMQPGDVQHTYANIQRIADLTGFEARTSLDEGIQKFVEWWVSYHKD
jgi:UDP-glucuronate 4-epimerase